MNDFDNQRIDIELTKLVRKTIGDKEFQPYAVFHESLDTIIAQTRDCSYTLRQVDKSFAILEDNYPEEGEDKCVGFEIYGFRHACMTYGLSYPNPCELHKIYQDFSQIHRWHEEDKQIIMKIIQQVPAFINIPS